MADGKFTALDLIKKVEEEKKQTELKVKHKTIERIIIDYREQLTRFDLYAIEDDYVYMVQKPERVQSEELKQKIQQIIDALDKWRPVKVKMKVKVDLIPVGPDNDLMKDITGDVLDIEVVEVVKDILNTPIFVGKGTLGISRSGAVRLRTDSTVYIVNTNTRNGERAKALAMRDVDVLFSIGREVE